MGRTDELMLSTKEKKILHNRREIIKSMKFLRLMGTKLRNQLISELEAIHSSEKLKKNYNK